MTRRFSCIFLIVLACAGSIVTRAQATEALCDPSFQNCRDQLLALIQNENVGIDVAFWFMQDARYESAIVKRWQAGIPVRILIDPRANPAYPGNDTMIADFQLAGIPLRKRTAPGILHWKMMLFAGQNAVEFGSANYSPNAFVPNTPYLDYVNETVYYTDDPAVVNSFKTKYDDSWTDTTNFTNDANITNALTRTYATYPIDPELNFPPGQDFANRSVPLYNHETQKIDVIEFRITDRRHTDAMIAAHGRGVAMRMILENAEYRNPKYLWDAWNVDRLYAAGIPVRWRGHAGQNHGKITLLYSQGLSIFGSSNWTSASANSQQEHNYFTTKRWIFQWFQTEFERMWNNTNPVDAAETVPFMPAPADKPVYQAPSNGSSVTSPTSTLTWYGGPWAHNYDIYFGTSPAPPLLAANVNLGPSLNTSMVQKYVTPQLTAGTTYYWQIVSKTMANLTAAGPVWSFSTPGTGGGGLPAPWTDVDVGAVGVAGSATANGSTINVSGSGADIWGTADAFNFVSQPLNGDGEITARVASVQPVAAWSKAGVMIRDTASAGSAYAYMLVSASRGTAFQYRTAASATAASVTGTPATAPAWVRIVRAGAAFTAYQSADGTSWQAIGTVSVAMGASVQVGLAVVSHDNSALCAASFDQVVVQ